MKTYIKVLTVIVAMVVTSAVTSCERDNPDPGGTATQSLAGEYWVHSDSFPGSYFHIIMYNTSTNSPTEMWFDDAASFWDVKGKITTDQNNLTFSGANIQNVSYDSQFTITDGKVMKGIAKGPVSKAVTDSIEFKISFSDDDPANTVYTFTGYARTRYSDDDH